MTRTLDHKPSGRSNGNGEGFISSQSRFWVAASVLIAVNILFGGASRADIFVHFVPRTLAILVIAALVWRGWLGISRWSWPEKLVWALLLAVPLIQQVPLPWDVWTSLPGRDFPRDALAAIGQQGWAGLSLMPDHTWNSWLALLPPFAVYAFARQASDRRLQNWAFLIVILALVSALLGIAQMVGGGGANLRFYAITVNDAGVGLFSNSNHQGTFLACGMLMLAWWYRSLPGKPGERDPLIIGLGAFAAILLGLGLILTKSQASLIFLLITTAVLLFTVMRTNGTGAKRSASILIIALIVMTGAIAFALSDDRIAEFTDGSTLALGRLRVLPVLLEMARDNWLFGTGLGSFDPVYQTYEPLDLLIPQYLNHAHNDYLELIIEAGLPAIVGLLVFFGWLGAKGWSFYKQRLQPTPYLWFRWLAIGGIGVILMHSVVDYPLRCVAISTLFALFCAMIAREPEPGRRPVSDAI